MAAAGATIGAVILGVNCEFDMLLDKISEILTHVKDSGYFAEAFGGFEAECYAGNKTLAFISDSIVQKIQAVSSLNDLFFATSRLRSSVVEKVTRGSIKAEHYADEIESDEKKEEIGREIAKGYVVRKWNALKDITRPIKGAIEHVGVEYCSPASAKRKALEEVEYEVSSKRCGICREDVLGIEEEDA